MNASIEQYLRVFVNHQQEDWVKWLPLAEFAANNEVSQTTKCNTLFEIQGMHHRISLTREPTTERGQQRVNADEVPGIIQQIHEHLRLEMR